MKLEILIPLVITFLTLVSWVAVKFNETYEKHIKKYIAFILWCLMLALLAYFKGINDMYCAVMPEYEGSVKLSTIYNETRVDFFTYWAILIVVLLYVHSVGFLYGLLVDTNKGKVTLLSNQSI